MGSAHVVNVEKKEDSSVLSWFPKPAVHLAASYRRVEAATRETQHTEPEGWPKGQSHKSLSLRT